jgi:hypothetical protein
MKHFNKLRLTATTIALLSTVTTATKFNPYEYEPLKNTANCQALNRKEDVLKNIELRGLPKYFRK